MTKDMNEWMRIGSRDRRLSCAELGLGISKSCFCFRLRFLLFLIPPLLRDSSQKCNDMRWSPTYAFLIRFCYAVRTVCITVTTFNHALLPLVLRCVVKATVIPYTAAPSPLCPFIASNPYFQFVGDSLPNTKGKSVRLCLTSPHSLEHQSLNQMLTALSCCTRMCSSPYFPALLLATPFFGRPLYCCAALRRARGPLPPFFFSFLQNTPHNHLAL